MHASIKCSGKISTEKVTTKKKKNTHTHTHTQIYLYIYTHTYMVIQADLHDLKREELVNLSWIFKFQPIRRVGKRKAHFPFSHQD